MPRNGKAGASGFNPECVEEGVGDDKTTKSTIV
jgi:hypothetical protein